MRKDFAGELYEHEGDEYVFPGGTYLVDWERKGVTDDFDMEYDLEHFGSGFSVEAKVRFDYSSMEPVIDRAEVESTRETFDGVDVDLFKKIWKDVRSAPEG